MRHGKLPHSERPFHQEKWTWNTFSSVYHLPTLGSHPGSFTAIVSFQTFGSTDQHHISESFLFSCLHALIKLAQTRVIVQGGSEDSNTALTLLCGGSANSWPHFGKHGLAVAQDISTTGYTQQGRDSGTACARGVKSSRSLDAISKQRFLLSYYVTGWIFDSKTSQQHKNPQYLSEIHSPLLVRLNVNQESD